MDKIKILAVSDIHNDSILLESLHYKKADILIIAGDLTNRGTLIELSNVLNKINDMPNYKSKVIVFGNHDIHAEENIKFIERQFPDLIFLTNETKEVQGINIYGTPYTKEYGIWGFAYKDIDMRRKLTTPKTINNKNIDIIVSHEPPSLEGISETVWGEDIGNPSLRRWLQLNDGVQSNNGVKFVISGHVHECGGLAGYIGSTRVMNVSRKITPIMYKLDTN